MTQSKIQEVDSLGLLEGLYVESSAHGHLASETGGSDELRELVASLLAMMGGRTFQLGTRHGHWNAIHKRLDTEGQKLWVETVPGTGMQEALAPAARSTHMYAFHIARQKPQAGLPK
ncbi:MAG TPA: hypothetical protein VE326_02740 [Candidatus Binatia bacterium]|nr:hypothetical protein [Candidatus Binatia bacterium]